MKRGVVLAVVLLAAAGCGKLTKDDAKAMMQAKFYDKDDNVYCTWTGSQVSPKGASGTKKLYAFFNADENASCIDELDVAGIIKKGACTDKRSDGSCFERAFDLGPNVDIHGIHIRFACGKKKLDDVTSISTADKKATVKYTRTITRDDALAKKVSDCALDGPKSGSEDQSLGFLKDDDGKWSPVE